MSEAEPQVTLIDKFIKKEKKSKAVKEPKEKKPRAYSFIQAFAEWRKGNNWSGLCPKKGSDEYQQIREIYETKRAK